MGALKKFGLSAANHLGVYRPARNLYRVFFDAGREQRRRIRNCHRQLLTRNALVFDIGAHTGEYAEIFASLGARVIAVEPDPKLTALIRQTSPRDRVTVVEAAAGAEVGRGKLRLCSANGMSSMSEEWIDITKRHERLNFVWGEEIDVPIVTVDSLRERFGDPDFIKIDVEGFELQVLSGMSKQPPLLSFEFNPEAMDACFKCIETFSPESRFNFALGTPECLNLNAWATKCEIIQLLAPVATAQTYGDVFVRLT